MNNDPFFNHLKVRQRISLFLKTKKKRFAMIFVAVMMFQFFGNAGAGVLG